MKEKIAQIEQLLVSELAGCENLQALDAVRVKVLGKKGELTAVLKQNVIVNSFKELVPRMNDIFIKLVTEGV